jgi:PadR family transcriptional regulator PadR
MNRKRTNPDFLNGVPELLLLKLLSQRPMHGYDLVQALKAATQGELEFGEGCIYPILHRLEADKLLASARVNVGGRERLVYRATPAGKKRLAQSATAWQRVTDAIAHALQGGAHGQTKLA